MKLDWTLQIQFKRYKNANKNFKNCVWKEWKDVALPLGIAHYRLRGRQDLGWTLYGWRYWVVSVLQMRVCCGLVLECFCHMAIVKMRSADVAGAVPWFWFVSLPVLARKTPCIKTLTFYNVFNGDFSSLGNYRLAQKLTQLLIFWRRELLSCTKQLCFLANRLDMRDMLHNPCVPQVWHV